MIHNYLKNTCVQIKKITKDIKYGVINIYLPHRQEAEDQVSFLTMKLKTG